MRHGSLFSGIGGFDLAAEWMGWENVFHCEMNPFGRQVLNYYWPNSISYDDITKTAFTIHRGTIDILTGGFPCQPYSHAGKRLGKEDERHLWPEMLRAIREIQPTWVVGENVSGLISWNGGLVFHEVQTDLEAEGYEVQPFVLPACAVNAPHRRDRVWFIAYSESNGNRRRLHGTEGENGGKREPEKCRQDNDKHWNNGTKRATTNAGLFGQTERQQPTVGIDELCEERDATDTKSQRHEPFDKDRTAIVSTQIKPGLHGRGCDKFNPPGTWSNFPTQPPVRSRNDGLSAGLVGITVSKHRNESIKAYGNAIVPQVALQIFKAIAYL